MDSEISRRVFKDPAGYQQLDVWISRHIKGTLLFQPPQDLNLFGAKPATVGFTQLLDGLDCVMKLNFLGPFDVRRLSRIPSQRDQIPQHASRRFADEVDLV